MNMPLPRPTLFLLWLLLLPAVASGLSFTFSDVQKAPCQHIVPIRPVLQDDATQKDITLSWIKTHDVSAWSTTHPVAVRDPQVYPVLKQHAVDFGSQGAFYMKTKYNSLVELPSLLASIMDTHITTHTTRESFVAGNVEHKFATVTNIPLLGFIHVYTKSAFLPDGTLYSMHNVDTGDLPWIAIWAQDVVRRTIKDSVSDFQREVSLRLCGA